MSKSVFFLVLIIALNWCFTAQFQNASNSYEINKMSVSHPHERSKSEHGRLAFIRPIIILIVNLSKGVLAPLKLGVNTAGIGVSLVEKCIPVPKGLDTNHTFFTGILDDFKNQVKLIVPGTKWCGAGNIAKNNNDLGVDAESDRCCKNHDQCPLSLAAGERKYGLKNSGLFTRSECSCDKDFYNCLKKVDSAITYSLGITYFNTLGPQCFELVNCSDPKIKCRGWREKGTQYQWSDNPRF